MINLLEHTRRPDITFCRNGRILITARVARILSLRPGDTINIARDNNGEFLLFATHYENAIGHHVAQCYPTKKGSRNFCANSVSLCRSIFQASNVSGQRAAFMAGEPVVRNYSTYVPIITRRPL